MPAAAPTRWWPEAGWPAVGRARHPFLGVVEGFRMRKMPEQQNQFTAVFEPSPEGGWIAWVEELPGAVTQGETLEEARENLTDAVEMILEANRELRGGSKSEGVIRETITVYR